MKLFVLSLDFRNNQDVKYWYQELPPKEFPSLGHLIEAFNKQWDPNMDEYVRKGLIDHVQGKSQEDIRDEEIKEDT